MKKFSRHGISILLIMFMAISIIPGIEATVNAADGVCITGGSHTIERFEAKKPLYTEAGWEAYEVCTQPDCPYTTFKAIPALGEPEINDYGTFIENLTLLEMIANQYVMEFPGNDPLGLVIKYIRTGVDRYNSGSWGIMAGYEDKAFADYVRRYENEFNNQIENVDEYFKFTALKNINNFTLPNGNMVDLGHMFGTLDISYTNKNSLDHADVGGWAGDLVDLMSSADTDMVSGEIEEMVAILKEGYFLKNPQPNDVFSLADFYGDLDAYYVFNTLLERGYSVDEETGIGTLTQVIMEYFTETLSQEDRAKYFLKNRLGNVGTREQVRNAVYNAYTGNQTITTLEATREFKTSQENIVNLRKASCYVFADYICNLAGDYVEIENNPYYSDYNVETSSLAPGVMHETHYATTQDGKQMVYYTATADLSNKNLTVYANYNENDPELGWNLSRVLDQANAAQNKYGDPESDKYIENYQVVASINADGFDMGTGEPGGLLVMNGTEYHPANSSGFFGITKDGKAVIGTTAEYKETYKDILRDGVGAFGVTLVKDGKIAVAHNDNYTQDRASRTAVGITKTGKVVFMVLDGRQEPRSCGGSMQEIAQIMLEAGCQVAVNLDGGGSTTFVTKPEGEEELKVTNSPSDGYARSVSTSLMMVSTAPSSTKFDHARLDSDYSYVTTGTPIKITPVGLSATGNVVDLPENCQWRIATFADSATISEDGVFVGNTNWRDVDIELVCDGAVIGHTTIHVVSPNNVYFERKTLDTVFGAVIDIPVAAVYNGNAVAINENDVILSINPAKAGTIDGYKLTVGENTSVKTASVIATLAADESISSTLSINIYKQGENTFDFDKATGGNREFAWYREVSNSVTDDNISYTAIDSNEDMVTSYIFAIDMREIPIPTQLEDLTYMLPGADDMDASAWNFLLQLAERISVLTEVKPVLKFDPRFDVDYSEIEVINEYFYLDKTEFDAEKNELTLILKWHDQTSSIKPETANPLCMVKGIKLTPKDDAYNEGKINAVHMGEASYTIYLRASALYTFSSKPENQEIYGLYPFKNTFIDKNGEEQDERGGYFHDIYKEIEDRYTLSCVKKNGWINEEGGFAYYIEGEKLTGVQLADGYYYDFGANGINVGQTKYTGFFEKDGKTYYARLGELIKSKWQLVGDTMYHCHDDGEACITTVKNPITCVKGGVRTYTCTQCATTNKSAFVNPEGHDWDNNYKCHVCGTQGVDIATGLVRFGKIDSPRTSTSEPRYEQTTIGVRPSTHITFDEKTALTWSNDATLNSDHTMRDLYVSWTNDRGIGKAYVNFTGKGNYYGEAQLTYSILPANVKNFKAEPSSDAVTLTWNKSPGAGYYRVYRYKDGKRTKLGETTGTTYTVTGLDAQTEYTFSVASSAVSTDGQNKVYNCSKWADVTTTTKALPATSGMVSNIKAVVGVHESNMLTINDVKYVMLPGSVKIDAVKLSLVATSGANGRKLSISGDLGSETANLVTGSNTVTFDLSGIATVSGGKYNVNLSIDSAAPMEIVIMHGAKVPSMFITSDDPEKDRDFVDREKTNKATGSMYLVNASGTKIYDGNLTEIKARGNSTFAHYNKKAYQIKLGTKTDLIGNGEKIKTWVLLANYGDATMMHDKFMKDLAQEFGMSYTADSDWINLWYDGEYRGTYLISEKNSVGSTSVDVTDMEEGYEDLNPGYGDDAQTAYGANKYGQLYQYTVGLTDPEDITGGYLIELNHDYIDEVNGFKTRQGKGINIKSPEWLSESAVKYISEYYQEFEDAVYAVDGNGQYTGYNEETGKYFYEYVDLDSLVKIFAIQEIGLNPDGFISSLYFNKDANDIMYVGPIWDQDMTLGTGWSKYISSSTKDYHYLAEALINIPVFKARLSNFFGNKAVEIVEETISQGGTIDKNYNKLSQSAEMNYTLWPYVRVGDPTKSEHIWENATYDLVVDDMKSWLGTRLGILKERLIVDDEHEHVWDAGKVTVEPTYTEAGEKTYTCIICDEEKTEILPIITHTHDWDDGIVTLEPTCTENGEKTYTCTLCGEEKTEEIGTTDHTYGSWQKDDAVNHKKVCVCGDVVKEIHDWDDGVVTLEPTYTEVGEKTYTCTVCGEEKIETLPIIGHTHDWDDGVVTLEPTCTEAGEKTYTCTVCGEEKTEAIASTGHSYGEWEAEDDKNHKKECSCGDVVREIHDWDDGVITIEPTYTEVGEKTYTCAVCDEEKTEILPIISHTHDWDDGVVTLEPTCTEAGEKTYTCIVCDEEKTEVIASTGHTYGEWEMDDEENHKNKCSCGDIIKEAHTWDDGVVSKAPTETEPGVKTYTCEVCSFTKTEEIPAIAENVTLTVGNVRARTGMNITVPISISNNSGLTRLEAIFEYNTEVLTLTGVKAGNALGNLTFTPPADISVSSLTFVWDGEEVDDTNGDILYLNFSIADEALIKKHKILVNFEITGNQGENDVTVILDNGNLTLIEHISGDANNDKFVDGKDVVALRQYLAEGYGVTISEQCADVNKDGKLDVKDIVIMRRYIVGGYGVELK